MSSPLSTGSGQLSELQLAVMRAVWVADEATVAEVHEALAERGLAPTTVATLLNRLEKRGLLSHRTEGRQFVYRALVAEDQLRTTMVEELTDRVFAGDVAALVSQLLADHEIDAGELARVRSIIDARLREGSDDGHR